MIDPITALAVASTAVGQAKSLLAAGRDATSALSKFAGAVSDVNYAAEKAKKPGLLALLTGSAEQAAVDAFAAQKKMQAMRKEIETIIQYQVWSERAWRNTRTRCGAFGLSGSARLTVRRSSKRR